MKHHSSRMIAVQPECVTGHLRMTVHNAVCELHCSNRIATLERLAKMNAW